jgi:class 3 adenylate cyclase
MIGRPERPHAGAARLAALRHLRDAGRRRLNDRVVVRDRGSVTVKGRSEPVEIFELLSLKEAGSRLLRAA